MSEGKAASSPFHSDASRNLSGRRGRAINQQSPLALSPPPHTTPAERVSPMQVMPSSALAPQLCRWAVAPMVSRWRQASRQAAQTVDLHGTRRSCFDGGVFDDHGRVDGRRCRPLPNVRRPDIDRSPAMTTVGSMVYQFFEHHLKAEKGLSQASIRGYRDGIRLFLLFLAKTTSGIPSFYD